MVDVSTKQCSIDSCTKRPSFNRVGSMTAVYCKYHADEGMVNVWSNRRSHQSCGKRTLLNVAGTKETLYLKQHAEDGIVDAHSNRCSYESCTGWPRWGTIAQGSASVCSRHKSNLSAGVVVDFNQTCEATIGRVVAAWGLEAQLTHCPDHGRLRDSLSRVVGADERGDRLSSSSYRAERGRSFRVKAECLF